MSVDSCEPDISSGSFGGVASSSVTSGGPATSREPEQSAELTLRSDLDVLQDTLAGLTSWHEISRQALKPEQVQKATREARMDTQRRLEAIKRSQAALLARLDVRVEASVGMLGRARTSALVVHRNTWMVGKLGQGLSARGIDVLPALEDGADGLGAVIAEQPDLLLVEDLLPSLQGVELVRYAQRLAPRTVVAAQVVDSSGVAAMVDAGARAVFTRRIPPDLMSEQLAEMLTGVPSSGPLLCL